MSAGWCWYFGGNHRAVRFDEEKTDGIDRGIVEALGAVTHPDWPDGEYQWGYLHIFVDDGGYPGEDTFGDRSPRTTGGRVGVGEGAVLIRVG